jgi:hypothetical protein
MIGFLDVNGILKLSIKSGKYNTKTPYLVTQGMRFKKTGKKNTLGFNEV